MITENPIPFRIKTLPGQNAKFEDLELQDKWVEQSQNTRYEDEPGSVDKRDPVSYYNSVSVGEGAVVGIHRFYTSTGTIKFLMVHDTTCYVGDDAAGTWTAIKTGLTAEKRMAFETYRDKLIMSNGFDNMFVYDGSSDNVSWELGSLKAVSSAGAGSLDVGANYYYAITFGTTTPDQIVNGAVSNTVTVGSTGAITLSNIPLGPAGTDKRRIYRTEGGGTTLKLLHELTDNTTVTYEDTIADGSLTTAYPAVTDDMPKGSLLQLHRERLLISGDPSSPNTIYYSLPYLPHLIRQDTNLDFMEISPEDGDEIMGIPIHLGLMYCIKKNTIRPLHITSAVSGADPATWYADDPIAFLGSPAQRSILQTPAGIIFLGWDHWYRFDGATTEMIIDEFDSADILETSYSDTVAFYIDGVLLAAYTAKESASQYHDRIMRYNFKRQALSVDVWTSETLTGANCFATKSGDDETGDLYMGDSKNGYVVKEKSREEVYRLSRKTDCLEGTDSDVFIGGTETAPYIEIGSSVSASAIPDGVLIFWDEKSTSPGAGWVDVTATYENRLIKFGDSLATGGDSSHEHTGTATTPQLSIPTTTVGDTSRTSLVVPHGHSVSCDFSSDEAFPRYVNFRIFQSSGCTTTEFPDGAIVMWDQATAPIGWESLSELDGYYIKIYKEADEWDILTSYEVNDIVTYQSKTYSCITENTAKTPSSNAAYWTEGGNELGVPYESFHQHDVQGSLTTDSRYQYGNYNASPTVAHYAHAHSYATKSDSADLSSWELSHVGFTLIKKVGESESWDGVLKYVYCPCLSAPTGWTLDSTYDGKFLKCLEGAISSGDATSGSHNHFVDSVVSSESTLFEGGPSAGLAVMLTHTHVVSFSSISSVSPADPSYVQVMLYKYVLGKMKDYNDAISVTYTSGSWTSASQQINAESLNKIYWNESVIAADTINFYTRTGASKSACESASWSSALGDPNGSTIASTPDSWFQYKIELTATDTMISNPRVYFSDGYVTKYTYGKGTISAETSVSLIYKFGFRNFDSPLNDKSFKKIGTVHDGESGSFTVAWETENASDSFVVSLFTYPKRWESYFQDTAMGREINLSIEKNDLYPFRLKEIKGIYTEQPINL